MPDPIPRPPEGEPQDGYSQAVEGEIAQLLQEQCRRWQRGERVLAEAYREQYPALARDPVGMVDLIYNEILQRRQQGETPRLEEYTRRFPEHAEDIRRQFSVHRAFATPAPGTAEEGWPWTPATTDHGPAEDLDGATGPERPPGSIPDRGGGRDDWPEVPGYEILERLGKGGMGVVYRARHRALDRVVALKMLRGGDLSDSSEVRRFTAEALAMARLDHPHVVPIYEVGEHQGQPYFTMKLLVGGSLDRHLGRFRADPRRAVGLVEKVARAVHYLHEHKILHRDLKPLNILLDEHDEPFVSDFGLAKLLEGGLDLTVEGTVLGTLPYMAPEQARGQTHLFGSQTEVWTLGVILYELLTGSRPFAGRDRGEVTRLILAADFPRPRELRQEIDPALERIVLRCLRKVPGDRYPSAEVLAEDLRGWLLGRRPSRLTGFLSGGYRRAKRHPIMLGAGTLSVVAGVLLAGAFLGERWGVDSIENPDTAVRAPTPSIRLVGQQGGPLRPPSWAVGEEVGQQGLSPLDGSYLVSSSDLSLLEFGDGIRWPGYRLEAEVRHDESARGEVGVYVGRKGWQTARGTEHTFCKVGFADGLRLGGGRTELVFHHLAGRGLSGATLGYRGFTPAGPGVAKVWHRVVVEVTSRELHVFWDGTSLGKVAVPQIEERADGVMKEVPGDGALFDPAGGFGLYVYDGAASFRKVTVRPISQER
jgi:tRNA A-37 threonylcarbamoyl transferase component Bud32